MELRITCRSFAKKDVAFHTAVFRKLVSSWLFSVILFTLVFAITIFSIFVTAGDNIQKAWAVGGTVDGNTCSTTFGGIWDGVNQCTIVNGITIGQLETMTIPNGVNLVIANSAGIGLTNSGTLINSGTIIVSNTGATSFGISNTASGTFNNSGGQITVSNTAGLSGIYNGGTMTNSGTITVSDTYSARIYNAGTLTNSGTISISNTATGESISNYGIINNNSGGQIILSSAPTGFGIYNGNTINNSGTITISNTVGEGMVNDGTFNNNSGGQITISNTGGSGFYNGGTLTNSGAITITGTTTIGLINASTINNSGTITISNTAGYGISNLSSATITNSATGTITISNSGGNGIENVNTGTTLVNSGAITITSPGIGIHNGGGASITNSATGTITISCSCIGTILITSGGLTNSGTISVTNTRNDGVALNNQGTLTNTNTGLIVVSNTAGYGIVNYASFTNSGIITISNSGGFGIGNFVLNTGTTTLTNSGAINNSGDILNDCGITYTNTGTFTGNPVVDACDSDSDSIANAVDTQPSVASADFSDTSLSGSTAGTIVTKGNECFSVRDDSNPLNGVRIYVTPLIPNICGPTPAQISSCNGASMTSLTPGDDIVITCGSVTEKVIAGPVEMDFAGSPTGCAASASVGAGNTLKFYPETCTFSTPNTNHDTLTVTIGGSQINIAPGVTIPNANGIQISIDIMPGTFPNIINPTSNGVTPVAILGTSTFDVKTVDPTTVKFGPNHTPETQYSLEDVNKDKKLDLVLKFKTNLSGITCGQTSATLTGLTKSGVPIQGSDSVKVGPCK